MILHLRENIWRVMGGLILVMWVASVYLPVVSLCETGKLVYGKFFLFWGPWSFLHGNWAWYANLPALIIAAAMVCNSRFHLAMIIPGLMFGPLALDAFSLTEIPLAAGIPSFTVCSHKFGFWLWLAAIGLATVSPIARYFTIRWTDHLVRSNR